MGKDGPNQHGGGSGPSTPPPQRGGSPGMLPEDDEHEADDRRAHDDARQQGPAPRGALGRESRRVRDGRVGRQEATHSPRRLFIIG